LGREPRAVAFAAVCRGKIRNPLRHNKFGKNQ